MPKPINKTQGFSFFVQQPSWTFSSRKVPWDHLGSWQQLLLGVPDPGVSRPQKSGKKSELWRCWKKPFPLKKQLPTVRLNFWLWTSKLGVRWIFFLNPKNIGARSGRMFHIFSPNSSLLGSQCFLGVSALSGMLCPPLWACLPSLSRNWSGRVWFHMQFLRWCNLGVRSMLRGWGIQVFWARIRLVEWLETRRRTV